MARYNFKSGYKAVVIGGSAGSFQGVLTILAQIPKDFALPIILTLHRLKHVRHGFVEAFAIRSEVRVVEPDDKDPIKKSTAYLAPANYHLSVELGHYFALSTEEFVNSSRPSIDVTLNSAAFVYRHRLIGILLSGANRDGGMGMKSVKDRGGITVVQRPDDCAVDVMPKAALSLTSIDYSLSIPQIVEFMNELHCQHKSVI